MLAFCKEKGVEVVGLHQHMGSNFKESGKLLENIKLMLRLCG
jgi:hypothetical protein